jgi:hypothetical protein
MKITTGDKILIICSALIMTASILTSLTFIILNLFEKRQSIKKNYLKILGYSLCITIISTLFITSFKRKIGFNAFIIIIFSIYILLSIFIQNKISNN